MLQQTITVYIAEISPFLLNKSDRKLRIVFLRVISSFYLVYIER